MRASLRIISLSSYQSFARMLAHHLTIQHFFWRTKLTPHQRNQHFVKINNNVEDNMLNVHIVQCTHNTLMQKMMPTDVAKSGMGWMDGIGMVSWRSEADTSKKRLTNKLCTEKSAYLYGTSPCLHHLALRLVFLSWPFQSHRWIQQSCPSSVEPSVHHCLSTPKSARERLLLGFLETFHQSRYFASPFFKSHILTEMQPKFRWLSRTCITLPTRS